MALATFCSRILGLVREQVLAYTFGASGVTDAFLVAYRIPNLLRDLFAEGAFSAAFVPTFVEVNHKDPVEARRLFWQLFILLLIITTTISGLTFYFAPELISIFAPKFLEDPEKFALTVKLTQFMSPFLIFVSLAALFMGVLNSLKVFFIPSFAPVFFNISMIASMLIFPSILIGKGYPAVYSLGIGVFIGGILQALVQFPLILKKGFAPVFPRKIVNKNTKKVFAKLGPGLIGFAATQINLIVNTVLASSTVVGAVSWLSFAFRLFQLPVGILSVSIGNSNLVHFSNAWKAGDKKGAIDYLSSSFFLSCFLVTPAMVALLVCKEEMIHIIFERGEFSRLSTIMTSEALFWYALGLPFYSIYKIFVPTFYTLDRQKIPVITSIISVVGNIVFCVLLTPIYGYEILALGTTLSMFCNSFIQGIILHKDLRLGCFSLVNLRIVKIIIAGLISYGVIYFIRDNVDFYSQAFVVKCLILTGYLALIALSYFVICAILGESSMIKKLLKRFK